MGAPWSLQVLLGGDRALPPARLRRMRPPAARILRGRSAPPLSSRILSGSGLEERNPRGPGLRALPGPASKPHPGPEIRRPPCPRHAPGPKARPGPGLDGATVLPGGLRPGARAAVGGPSRPPGLQSIGSRGPCRRQNAEEAWPGGGGPGPHPEAAAGSAPDRALEAGEVEESLGTVQGVPEGCRADCRAPGGPGGRRPDHRRHSPRLRRGAPRGGGGRGPGRGRGEDAFLRRNERSGLPGEATSR